MSRGGDRIGTPLVQSSFEFAAPPQSFEALDRGASNTGAIAFLQQAADWPFPVACLTGPPRSGRTTLAQAWANSLGGRVLEPQEVSGMDVDAVLSGGALAIDPGDRGLPEDFLLSLVNRVGEMGGRLLLTADAPPLAWPVENRDLASRLAAMPTVELERPDEEMIGIRLTSLLARKFQTLPQEVVRYLAPRLKRTFADIEACATRLAGQAGPGRDLTVLLARSVIEDMYGQDDETGEGIGDG
ncbi:MAG: DnaA/Hda family protein [Hyphomonadaceae bacterium]|nr:DnaA/Hda family protein [Hyphomonadaceae bacterium]